MKHKKALCSMLLLSLVSATPLCSNAQSACALQYTVKVLINTYKSVEIYQCVKMCNNSVYY